MFWESDHRRWVCFIDVEPEYEKYEHLCWACRLIRKILSRELIHILWTRLRGYRLRRLAHLYHIVTYIGSRYYTSIVSSIPLLQDEISLNVPKKSILTGSLNTDRKDYVVISPDERSDFPAANQLLRPVNL
ncbi:hypothetical protein BDW59DRAFT_34707 [Aspergillus cavernicola]|uniref:Uncharacterized protein n=1 Tax=Aspergillus cavernicola TaxID=176166 RepID=A0ABR4IPW8_9EURO